MLSSKEFTVFVVDCNPYMGKTGDGQQKTNFEVGLKYFYDHTTNLLLKNRKLDRIGLVKHGDDALFNDSPFTYLDLKRYSQLLQVDSESSGDLMESVYKGLELFKPKIHLKYSRNLVIITNDEADLSISDQFEEYSSFILENKINTIAIGINCDAESEIGLIISKWKGNLIDNVESLIENSSILKKVAPRPICTTELKFGVKGDESDADTSLNINVQIYPATRIEKHLAGHEYLIANGKPQPIKRKTNYFIKEYQDKRPTVDEEGEEEEADGVDLDDESDEENYKKIEVDASQYIPAYKISKTDVQAVTDDLKSLSKLPTTTSFDILGFIKFKNLAYAYYVNESSYVLPSATDTSNTNPIAFNALVKTLLDFEGVAIVRYVPEAKKDISLCALLPTVLLINRKYSYGFILLQLAFKEDEKFGKFPWLTKPEKKPEEANECDEEDDDELEVVDDTQVLKHDHNKKEYPTKENTNLMDLFVKAHDLDKDEIPRRDIIDNQKLGLKDTQFLLTPKVATSNINSYLLASSPAIHKFNTKLKKIIELSLQKDSLFDFLTEDEFVEKYMVSDATNLFNLENILKVNTGTPDKFLTQEGPELAKKLIKSLKVKFVTKEESNKKRKTQTAAEAEDQINAEKAGFDEFFDVDELLGS